MIIIITVTLLNAENIKVTLLNAENIKEQQRLAVFTKSLFKEHNKQL